MSQLTTHILDTSSGIPAAGIAVTLFVLHEKEWLQLAAGITNSDGGADKLWEGGAHLPRGLDKLHFAIQV